MNELILEEVPTLLTAKDTELQQMTISDYLDLVNDDEYEFLVA